MIVSVKPKDAPNQFGPTGAHQACQAEYFSATNAKRDISKDTVLAQVLYDQDFRADIACRFGEHIRQFSAHHQSDELTRIQLVNRVCGDHLPVTQDGDLIGDLEDLIELM